MSRWNLRRGVPAVRDLQRYSTFFHGAQGKTPGGDVRV